jgi:hypothetical protein
MSAFTDIYELLEAVRDLEPDDVLDASVAIPDACRMLGLVQSLKARDGVLPAIERALNDHLAGCLGDGFTDVPDIGPVENKPNYSRTGWQHDFIISRAIAHIADQPAVFYNPETGGMHPPAILSANVVHAFHDIVGRPSEYRVGDARKDPPGPGILTTLGLDEADCCTVDKTKRKIVLPR